MPFSEPKSNNTSGAFLRTAEVGLVALIGEHKFATAPAAIRERLPDGSYILILHESLADSLEKPNTEERALLQAHIGQEWFEDRPDPYWYVPLRNLAIPEEIRLLISRDT